MDEETQQGESVLRELDAAKDGVSKAAEDAESGASVPEENWKGRTALFLFSQGVSLFGSLVVSFAVIWYITLTTGSGVLLTVLTVANVVPQIIISPFAGVWADRFSRKKLIQGADLCIAGVTLLLAVLFAFGHTEIWLIVAACVVRSLFAGVQQPAVNAFIPDIVPQKALARVSGVFQSVQSLMNILAPAFGGMLLSFTQLGNVFYVDVATAVLAVGIFAFLKVKKRPPAPKRPYFSEMREGLRYIGKNRYLIALVVLLFLMNFLVAPVAVLTPLLISQKFGAEVWRLTVNEMLFGGGAILGGVLIAVWGGFKRRMATIALGGVICGAFIVAMGVMPVFWAYCLMLLIVGVAVPLVSSPPLVAIQERVPKEVMGRVMSVGQVFAMAAIPLGTVLFGPLADVVSIDLQLIVTGALFVPVALSALFIKPLKGI